MRPLLPLAVILALAGAAVAQTPAKDSQAPTDLKIVKSLWLASGGDQSYVADNWASGPAVTSVAGAMSLGVNPTNTFGNGQVVYTSGTGWNSGRRGKGLNPVNVVAAVVLQNTGTKTIRAVEVDYIFSDPQTSAEFLRYRFRAAKKIRPGETEKVTREIYQRRGKYRKFYTPAEPGTDLLARTKQSSAQAVVARIEYTDGSVWQRP
jgi:hypothetical protein